MHHKRSDPKPQQSHSHHSHSPSHGAEQPESKALRGLLPVLLVAQLMVILDITATNIALPSLATDLHLTGSSISWAITSYSLVFGSLLLFGGRAADLLGRRRLFLTGLTIFTFSSIASALAGTQRPSSLHGLGRASVRRFFRRLRFRSSPLPSRAASAQRHSLPGAPLVAPAPRSAFSSAAS